MGTPLETHTFTTRELIGALLPDLTDCDAIKLRTKQGVLTIEVHAPTAQKGGPLSREAAMYCARPAFWRFLEVSDEEKATLSIRMLCGIESRAQLDHDPDAADTWRSLTADFMMWERGDA